MTIKQILHTLTIYKTKNMTKAALNLGISQSALSLSLKTLENNLGGQLFDRIGKELVPNSRGRYFVEKATPLYHAIIGLEKEFQTDSKFELQIAVSQSIGTYLLPNFLIDFPIKYPNIKMHAQIQNSESIGQMVINHNVDVGLIEGKAPTNQTLRAQIVAKDTLVVVTGSKKLAEKPVFIDSIEDIPWIMRENGSGTRDIFEQNLPKGFKPTVALELNSNEAIKQALKGREMCACLSEFVVADMLNKDLFIVPIINLTFSRNLTLLTHRHLIESNPFQLWKKELINFFSNSSQLTLF